MKSHMGECNASDHTFYSFGAQRINGSAGAERFGRRRHLTANRGSTGWTGAHPETGGATTDQSKPNATTGQSGAARDEAEAKDQPAIATGEDIKGPARQLPPSKTPE